MLGQKCDDYKKRGKQIIPGLTQLLSKRPDQFAEGTWPTYFQKAKGAFIWDVDGKKYLDMSISGIGTNVLGYCDEDVDRAVIDVIKQGNSSSLVGGEEVILAEFLCKMHPWADMVRYARCGGEAMAIAVRVARAATQKDKVAFCGYHGWHDWYLAANLDGDELDGHLLAGLNPLGVPKGLRGTALPFHYNKIEELENIVNTDGDDLAAIIIEPIRDKFPEDDFLHKVRALADKSGAVLVFDEVSAAFRLNSGGSHLLFDVNPDIAVFSKAISNGYPMAAILGKKQVMDIVQETFISSTYWTERIGPTAALATIKKYQKYDVANHLIKVGEAIQRGWIDAAKDACLKVDVGGIAPLSHFSFVSEKSTEMMTLFTQEMLKKGILSSRRFYANFSHTQEDVERYLTATRDIFRYIAGIKEDEFLKFIDGPVAKSGFQRLT